MPTAIMLSLSSSSTTDLAEFTDAPLLDRARALLYRAEVAVRGGDGSTAKEPLAQALSINLREEEKAAIAPEVAHAHEIVQGMA